MPQVGAAHGPPSPRVGSPPGAPGHCGARVWRWAVLWDARWWYQPPEALGGGLLVLEAGAGGEAWGCAGKKPCFVCVFVHISGVF